MDVASIRIFVDGLPKAARFYEEIVGLTKLDESDGACVFGESPMVVVEAVPPEDDDEHLVGRFVGLAFSTEDAATLDADPTAKGLPTDGLPGRQPWGGVLLHAKDPAGHTITFLERLASAPTPTNG